MNIKKLPDLFEAGIKKTSKEDLFGFLKLCLKYRNRLFCKDFFERNFSTPEKFLKFVSKCKDNIFCVKIGENTGVKAFFYLYDTKRAFKDFIDAKITFCVDRAYWGFGSFAIAKKGLRFLFKKLKIRKLSAEIIGENTLALSLLKRLGFELEAVLKNEYTKGDKAYNLYIFSKFNPDFEGDKIVK